MCFNGCVELEFSRHIPKRKQILSSSTTRNPKPFYRSGNALNFDKLTQNHQNLAKLMLFGQV